MGISSVCNRIRAVRNGVHEAVGKLHAVDSVRADVPVLWCQLYMLELCSGLFASQYGIRSMVGIGIVLIAIVGYFIFDERLSMASFLWIGVIVVGVIGLNISNKAH